MTKREQLIACCERLLIRHGYTQTGVNEILEETGLSKGALYYHFPKGKEALFSLALGQILDKELREIKGFCKGKPSKMVSKILDFYLEKQAKGQRADLVLFLAHDLKNTGNQRIKEQLEEYQSDWIDSISAYLKDRKESGSKKKARQFYTLLFGLLNMNEVQKSNKNQEAIEELLERIF
ncbi:MAG: TetR/AcrR family transcriptional regulator [Flavobacteriales bacterium]